MTWSSNGGATPQTRGVAVRIEGVSKRFGAVNALRDVSVTVEPGTVHAFVGENGAGKSTLGKVIAGVHRPDAGTLRIDGQERRYGSPAAALRDGVTIVAQEIALTPARSVIENVFSGRTPQRWGVVDRRRLAAMYSELTARAGFDLPGDAPVRTLRLADQQKVEILRALARDARLIVMDEPTAALTRTESAQLLSTIRELRAGGTTVVFVSHSLSDVLALADEVTVLRDGQVVSHVPAAEATEAGLIKEMIGRSLDAAFPPRPRFPSADEPPVMRLDGLCVGETVRDVSFALRPGEILGIAGLVGSGRSELAHGIFGSLRRTGGSVELDGKPFDPRSPRDAIRSGVVLLPESRKEQGLLLGRSIVQNVSLPHPQAISTLGIVGRRRERTCVDDLVRRVGVRAGDLAAPVGTLSGGNQQKVLFAKSLLGNPRVLIADEPTRGVDIGAKFSIYELLADMAEEQGMPIVLISSELEEVIGLAHRICVMRSGRVVATLSGEDLTQDAVMSAWYGAELHDAGATV